MPCVRIKEAYHNTKHIIDDIELSCKVEELKEKAAAKTNIPIDQQSEMIIGLFWPIKVSIFTTIASHFLHKTSQFDAWKKNQSAIFHLKAV